jgi:transmembrane sensor
VNLFEGNLEIKPHDSSMPPARIKAGEFISFGNDALLERSQSASGADAWSGGYIVADKMQLADFLEELARYRKGTIRCDPQIKELIVSGAFPLHDIDAILSTLSERLPVRIETFTRFWITIKPA